MKNISTYPWYMQHSPRFVTLYDGLFDWLNNASPLEIGEAFNVDQRTGRGLLYFGLLWGLRGVWGGTTDGLIYSIDEWSTDRVWTGSMKDAEAKIYRNFIRMKAHINSRPYSLILMKEALEILTRDMEAEFWVEEGYMSFIIHVTAPSDTLNMFYNMALYDPNFLGKPTGISFTWDLNLKKD